MCPNGYYIYGAEVRFESYQGGGLSGGDDTALNGIRIWCRDPLTQDTSGPHTIDDGHWGDWQGMVYSSTGYWKGAEVRFESSQGGGDDTAMNGLRVTYETLKVLDYMEFEFDDITNFSELESTVVAYDHITVNPTPDVIDYYFEY